MGDTRGYICPYCSAATVGHVAGITTWSGYDETGECVNPPVEHALVRCTRCNQAVVQIREDYGPGFDADEPVIVYPGGRSLDWSIPVALRADFNEASACFNVKAYSASAVMVRRVIEGVCKDLGAAESTLVKSLAKLRTNGLIDGLLVDWADMLRLMGNEGAHFTGQSVAKEDAEDALNFAVALLDHIYVFRNRFEAFKERMDRRKASQSP